MLNITKTGEKETMTVTLEGKLDTMTAPDLEEALKEAIDGLKELTIDMSRLEYLSSAGLRVLLGAQKTMDGQGRMVVVNPNEIIMGIFEDTGFNNILTIEHA